MPNIDKINGIDEDDISHHNGGTASLYATKNGDTWGHISYTDAYYLVQAGGGGGGGNYGGGGGISFGH